jgi:hypothetical protein
VCGPQKNLVDYDMISTFVKENPKKKQQQQQIVKKSKQVNKTEKTQIL